MAPNPTYRVLEQGFSDLSELRKSVHRRKLLLHAAALSSCSSSKEILSRPGIKGRALLGSMQSCVGWVTRFLWQMPVSM